MCPPSLPPPHRVNDLRGETPTNHRVGTLETYVASLNTFHLHSCLEEKWWFCLPSLAVNLMWFCFIWVFRKTKKHLRWCHKKFTAKTLGKSSIPGFVALPWQLAEDICVGKPSTFRATLNCQGKATNPGIELFQCFSGKNFYGITVKVFLFSEIPI